jgi:ribosomal-protein-serine acetyltransferase
LEQKMTDGPKVSQVLPASKLELLLTKEIADCHHVIIRPLEVTDAHEVVSAINESQTQLKKYMPWSHFPQTVESQQVRIFDNHQKYWSGRDFGFGVFAPDNKSFLGASGLHPRSLNQRCLEIGYWMRTSASGQGLCTEITKALIVYCFSYLDLDRVQCGYDTNNLASQRVNFKCGYRPEGVLRQYCPLPSSLAGSAEGWEGSGDITMTGILKEEISSLGWYMDTFSRLKVFDWQGFEAKAFAVTI